MQTISNEPDVVTTGAELLPIIDAMRTAQLLAVDVEGDGLFAYRPRLCTVQFAWDEGDRTRIVIVDTLAVDPKPLGEVLGAGGPAKVLHDFTFDVKLLADAGVQLERLFDTSVLARLLGRKATGLGSLLLSELGIVVPKHLQQHDWGKRPLAKAELEYLASDVRHLAALYEKLAGEARAKDIEEEVAVECVFKHEGALAPPREKRPAYLRVKESETLDAPGLAVLRRLVEEREQVAQQWNEPPFKVAGNDLLLSIARAKPRTVADLGRVRRGMSGRLFEIAPKIVGAVLKGLEDGAVPPADLDRGPRIDKAVMAARRSREKRLSAWRRTEAAARGVDEQVILPGHCLADLVGLETIDEQAVTLVRGLGAKRLSRYGATIVSLLAHESPAPPDSPSEPTA